MARHNEVGKWGEELASAYLQSKGYAIVQRNWHSGHRDIDIIAVTPDGQTTVFVEVKTRTSSYLRPEQAVDNEKIRNIILAANSYAKYHRMCKNMRFDIISIVGENEDVATIEHLDNAFLPMTAQR